MLNPAEEIALANAVSWQAAIAVIERAEQFGTPIAVWENGRVTKLDPKEVRRRMKLPPRPGNVSDADSATRDS